MSSDWATMIVGLCIAVLTGLVVGWVLRERR